MVEASSHEAQRSHEGPKVGPDACGSGTRVSSLDELTFRTKEVSDVGDPSALALRSALGFSRRLSELSSGATPATRGGIAGDPTPVAWRSQRRRPPPPDARSPHGRRRGRCGSAPRCAMRDRGAFRDARVLSCGPRRRQRVQVLEPTTDRNRPPRDESGHSKPRGTSRDALATARQRPARQCLGRCWVQHRKRRART